MTFKHNLKALPVALLLCASYASHAATPVTITDGEATMNLSWDTPLTCTLAPASITFEKISEVYWDRLEKMQDVEVTCENIRENTEISLYLDYDTDYGSHADTFYTHVPKAYNGKNFNWYFGVTHDASDPEPRTLGKYTATVSEASKTLTFPVKFSIDGNNSAEIYEEFIKSGDTSLDLSFTIPLSVKAAQIP